MSDAWGEAIRNCDLGTVKELLANGQSPDEEVQGAVTWGGERIEGLLPPVLLATDGSCDDVVQALADGGADLDARDPNGRTPLAYAVVNNDPFLAVRLYESGADLEATDDKGRSPLLMAADFGSEPVAMQLVMLGANPHAVANDGMTVAMHAVVRRFRALLERLIMAGIDFEARDADLNRTVLDYAAVFGRTGMVAELIDAGADINSADPERGWTPLMYALETPDNYNEETVRVLLREGARVDVRASGGLTPLMVAAEYGSAEMVRMLIKAGADVSAAGDYGRTPLFWAVTKSGNEEKVRLLLEAGASVDVPADDVTPLMQAALTGNPEMVRMLIDAGADISVTDEFENTAIDYARMRNDEEEQEIIKLLESAG